MLLITTNRFKLVWLTRPELAGANYHWYVAETATRFYGVYGNCVIYNLYATANNIIVNAIEHLEQEASNKVHNVYAIGDDGYIITESEAMVLQVLAHAVGARKYATAAASVLEHNSTIKRVSLTTAVTNIMAYISSKL